jgi:1-deoxy-D-xylulose-5-phosphate synthase
MHHEIPVQRPATPLLDTIDHPDQLKPLNMAQLLQLSVELRHYILYAAGQSGGILVPIWGRRVDACPTLLL